MRYTLFLIAGSLLLFSCTQSGTDSRVKSQETTDSLQNNTGDTTSIVDTAVLTQPIDPFDQQLDFAEDSLTAWGFSLLEQKIITDRSNFRNHWWLKVFHERNRDQADDFPNTKDWSSLQRIRQTTYKKVWQIILEEWVFETEKSAERWLALALNTSDLHHQKPPREYWIEGNKMYVVMFTTAHDWFKYSDQLIELVSGKTRSLISVLNQPTELPSLKRKLRGGNSGVHPGKPYFFKPDTVGTYFEYFWFHSLRARHREKAPEGLKILTYIYGDTVGYYEDVSEELIILKAKLNDPNLGSLDLVGYTLPQVEERFGMSYYRKDNNLVYSLNKSLLIIHLEADQVEWLKYVRTNDLLGTPPEIPTELLSY